MEIIKLISVSNKMEAEIIVQKLKENGINSYYKENGAGSYMQISSGYSVFGQEIYINREDEERAAELINTYNEGDDRDNSNYLQHKSRRKLIWVYLSFIMVMFLITMVIVILSRF